MAVTNADKEAHVCTKGAQVRTAVYRGVSLGWYTSLGLSGCASGLVEVLGE